jgi:glycosyltransferase domain-containing protein
MLTVVIPTYNRPDRLARSLRYWAESPFTVVVADGSRLPLSVPIPLGIDYRHDPSSSAFVRWGRAINSVRTPYTVLCADDDFHGFSALHRCVEFLEQHRDYSSVQGRYLYFREGREEHVALGYSFAATFAVTAESAAERLIQSMNPYMHQIYSVQRSEVLQQAIGDFPDEITNNAFELQVSLIAAIVGKHCTLPFLYSAREAVSGSAGAHYDQDQLARWVAEPRHAATLAQWRMRVANVYARVEDADAVDGGVAFDRALRGYLEFQGGLRKHRSVRRLVPSAVMALIRGLRDRLDRDYVKVCELFGETTPRGRENLRAFDWHNIVVQEDWARIRNILGWPSQPSRQERAR